MRLITSILFFAPVFFLVCLPFDVVFWALFCISLFPFSLIILIIHFFLGKRRRILKLNINEWDVAKIYFGFMGVIIGIVLWGVLYIVTYSPTDFK